MWNHLIKKKSEANGLLNFNARVHIEHPNAMAVFQANLSLFLAHLYERSAELIILCIGTDRSTGDSLGPLTGSKLEQLDLGNTHIFGTLDNPVHAVNLQDIIKQIESDYQNPFIIALDACLGRSESVGYISIKEGPLQPGTGVNKNLPAIGHIHIIGIVNVGGFMEYMVLQNTRLSLVMKMADVISQGLFREIQKLPLPEPALLDSVILPGEPVTT